MTKYFHWLHRQREMQSRDGHVFQDSTTGRNLCLPDAERASVWQSATQKIQGARPATLRQLADEIYALLTAYLDVSASQPSAEWVGALPSKHLPNARLADRALLMSAVACCIDDEPSDIRIQCLRVISLVNEFPQETVDIVKDKLLALGGNWDDSCPAVKHAGLLAASPMQFDGSNWLSSDKGKRQSTSKEDYHKHPLNGAGRIALVMGGAQQVKAYFLESSKLPEMRGASAILDCVNDAGVKAIYGEGGIFPVPECIIYSSGGSLLCLAPISLKDQIADEVERRYAADTLTCSAAAVSAEFDLIELHYGLAPTVARDDKVASLLGIRSETISHGFGELTALLASQLRDRRNGAPSKNRNRISVPSQPDSLALAERCGSCGLRTAVARVTIAQGEREDLLCESCSRKALVGRLTKRGEISATWQSVADVIDWQPPSLISWSDRFVSFLADDSERQQAYMSQVSARLDEVEPPFDLLDIASRDGTVGIIYADGNKVSSMLSRMSTPVEFRQLAETLSAATRRAVFEALAEVLNPLLADQSKGHDTYSYVHPFEILSMGGDDLFLIVPGEDALDVAIAISEKFERSFASYEKQQSAKYASRYKGSTESESNQYAPKLTLAAGVVIADASTPVASVRELAEELLKLAKAKSRRTEVSCIDFQALKMSGNMLDNISNYRSLSLQKSYESTGPAKKTRTVLHFTARPYTVHELKGLVSTARLFKQSKIPRTQLYKLRQSLLGSRTRGTLEYMYARAKATGDSVELFRVLDSFWHQPAADPWQQVVDHDGHYETFIADMLEIMPFVRTRENAHALTSST